MKRERGVSQLEEEEKRKWVGQKLPNQRKGAEASGEKGERAGEWSEEREETGQSEQGKEERREGEKRRKEEKRVWRTSDPRDPPVFFIHFQRLFTHFPVKLHHPTT